MISGLQLSEATLAPEGAALRTSILTGAGVVFGTDRVPVGRSARRAVARPDEDAVTLSAQAAALALPSGLERVGAILLATVSPSYQEGGTAQVLAELLGLHGDVFALDLNASRRDGLAALRLAHALVGSLGPVLVCASHVGFGDDRAGDGAVALLVDRPDGVGDRSAVVATLTPAASLAIELRDRWRLPEASAPHVADRSFAQAIGTDRLTSELLALVPEELSAAPTIVGPDAAASRKLEKALGGSDDVITMHAGECGAAQPLLRLMAGLQTSQLVVAVSNGLGEAVHVEPGPAAAVAADRVRRAAQDRGNPVDAPHLFPTPEDFDPFSSGPRSWRERDSDLRLQGLIDAPEVPHLVPGREHPTGTVIAWTRDHLYPGGERTEMATVLMDRGGQFYGQVAMGEHVSMGEHVELVPRRLHQGGGMIQYFWKVRPCP